MTEQLIQGLPFYRKDFFNKISPVIKTKVKNINLECVRPQRAGVIIITDSINGINFGMGIDSKTHDLTDFGGGISYKKDINVIAGALREFNEETLGIFDDLSISDISECPVIYDNWILIIFIRLDICPDVVSQVFLEKYTSAIDPEVCGITWLNWENFQMLIKTEGHMFSKVQKFLNRAGDLSRIL